MEHIGKLPCALGNIALDRMRKRIHTGCRGEPLRHRGHHIGIDDRDNGNIVRIDANEFAVFLHIGDDVVDRDLSRGSRRRRDGDGRDSLVSRYDRALEAADVLMLRIGDDDADRLCGIHRRAAADRDNAVSAGFFERGDACLNIFDRRIGLDIGINLIREARLVEQLGDFACNAEFQKVRI